MTNFIIPDDSPVLLGILNSKLFHWFFQNITSTIRGDYMRFKKQYVGQFPIVETEDCVKEYIATLVFQIQDTKKKNSDADVSHLERRIDQLVYQLYDLTPEEIQIIEESVK